MYITIDHASQFRDQFRQCGRGDQFSYEALNMLYEYLEEVDPQYELDVVALCCEYSEATPADIARDYSIEFDPENEDATFDAVREYLGNHSHLVGVTSAGSIIYQQF